MKQYVLMFSSIALLNVWLYLPPCLSGTLLFPIDRKEPGIPRDPEKKEKEVVSAVTGTDTVGIDIGDDLQTLVGTEVTIK